jgi:hypothetical protein
VAFFDRGKTVSEVGAFVSICTGTGSGQEPKGRSAEFESTMGSQLSILELTAIPLISLRTRLGFSRVLRLFCSTPTWIRTPWCYVQPPDP